MLTVKISIEIVEKGNKKKRGRRVVGGKKGKEMERKEVGDKTKTKYVKVFMIRVDSWLEGRNLLDDKLQCVRNCASTVVTGYEERKENKES